jgi:membrane-associated protease RseP (regulator of RpoE activity)
MGGLTATQIVIIIVVFLVGLGLIYFLKKKQVTVFSIFPVFLTSSRKALRRQNPEGGCGNMAPGVQGQ